MALLTLLAAGVLTHAGAAWASAGKPVNVGSPVLARCSWDSPGVNPYRGELVAAVDHYTDIPAATRATLKARMAAQRYDDIAVIGRNHITGQWHYSAELRDMHFGAGTVCRTVTRNRWAAQAEERGLVYCEAGHCLIVPTVCRNVSRVVRRQAVAGATTDHPAGTPGTQTLALAPESTELQFEAPSAGRALASGSDALPWTGPTALTLVGSGMDAPELAPLLSPAQPEPLAGIGSGAGGSNLVAPGALAVPSFTAPVAQPLDPFVPSGGGGPWVVAPTVPLPPAAPVPEPGTAALMALGLAAVARWARRPKRA